MIYELRRDASGNEIAILTVIDDGEARTLEVPAASLPPTVEDIVAAVLAD